MRRLLVLGTALALLPVGAGAGERSWVPFPTAWTDVEGGAADLSFLLKPPAGGQGFVTVRDGHLAEADGRRLRIWGINLSAAAGLPLKKDAPRLAAILARHGLNGVRFHYFDRPAPGGVFPADGSDTRTLDPEQVDRLDFLIAELKKRGIYTNINLNVARRYREGDGVRDHELLGFAKGLTHFDERLIELQKEYARQLLTHRNPYTGAEYRNEPAVAIVEMVNENSIVESWFSGRLLDVTLEGDFAAVTLSALDDRPIARSERLLLTAGAAVANTGLRWNEDGTGLVEWGGAPTVVERVRGRVALRGLEPAKGVEVTALDSGGREAAPSRRAERTEAGWEIELGWGDTV